jgi:hypothetical protein
MSSNNSTISKNGNNKKGSGNMTLIIVALAIILVIFFIYSTIISYNNYKKYSPYLIEGIVDATVPKQIKANQMLPSSDGQYGSEFSYSFWIFIKDTNFTNSSGTCSSGSKPLLHVFHKGSNDFIASGAASGQSTSSYYPLLEMPGVWLYPNTNKLNIRFNTYNNVVETADVGNIPLNSWVNIVITLIGSSVDVYVNGNLKKRSKLSGVPKINYGNLYVSNYGGFNGYMSKLRYYNYAVQSFQVDQIFTQGPSSQFDGSYSNGLSSPPPELSYNYWMTTGYPNTVNTPQYNQST